MTKDIWLSWPSECQFCSQALSHQFKGTCTFFQIRSQLTDDSDSLSLSANGGGFSLDYVFIFFIPRCYTVIISIKMCTFYTCWLT